MLGCNAEKDCLGGDKEKQINKGGVTILEK